MPNPIDTILAAVQQIRMRPLDWRQVANAINEVATAQQRIAGDEDALVALIDPSHTINVVAAELPHLQAPADMLRAAAIDALWKLTDQKYATLCAAVAAGSASPILKRLVAVRFPETLR